MASAVHMLGLESAPDTWIAFTLSLVFTWLRGWFYAGSGIESLLLLYGPPRHWSFSRYTLLLYLNVAYAIASTSWLFRAVFALSCWPLVLATCLVQYAAVSSFTRGRLRSLLKFVHFYQDRIAFFGLPSLVFDSGINGLMTIRGITFSILDLKLELHGIEIDLDLGSGHELSIHSDGITVNLFREIAIDEIYGVHWFDGQTKDKNLRNDSYVDDHCSSRSRSVSFKTKVLPDTGEERRRDVIRDKIMSRSGNSQEDIEPHTKSPLDDNVRRNRIEKVLSRGDVEAEQRYNHVLSELRRTNHLHQCRSQAKNLDASRVSEHEDESRHRPVVCSNFRNSKPPRSSSENQISLSSLMELLSPLSRLLDRAPIILRLFLWLLSQSHPVTCPAVCFSADGRYLGDEILESLFRKHAVEDSRIRQLKQEVSSWLSDADVYLDFMNLVGQSTVPVLTSNKITADLRSNGVALSRLGANITNGGRIGELSGVDAAFVIPTCLLPSHASIAPLPGKNENDTALVFMAIRASLPAHFSESFLNFAATLSKTSQMLDIEEEAGRIGNNKPACPGVDNQTTENVSHDQSHENESRTQRLREKLPHVHLGIATKHPVDHLKQSLHKRIKKTAVDKVDGAWFAKWTNKLLRQLEGLDGDVGYSTEIPVGITRDRE